jgi:Domain of unknown function (DUF6898)
MPRDTDGYIIEFVSMGNAVKVSAIDPATLTEVSIVGPANIGREELKRTVVKKLLYVMNKESNAKPVSGSGNPGGRGGIIV